MISFNIQSVHKPRSHAQHSRKITDTYRENHGQDHVLSEADNLNKIGNFRFDYGDKVLEVGVNKYTNGNTQGFQVVGNKKIR